MKVLAIFAIFVLIGGIIPSLDSAFAMETMGGGASIEIRTYDTPVGTLYAHALYVDADNAAGIIEPPGGDNDGVGKFLFSSLAAGGSFICSAALLAESTEVPVVLTAAHCVTDGLGNFDLAPGATVTFEGAGGDQVIGVVEDWTQIHPAWDGDFFFGNDLALLELESFPTVDIDRYFIDRTPGDDTSFDPENVGFGASGVGATGVTLPPGIKRASTNTYEMTGDPFFAHFAIPTNPGAQLVTDFDNGNPGNDANGFLIGGVVDPVGLALDEGISAGGDSGGPHFNGAKEITGVTSWGATLFAAGGGPDIDNTLNSSFGEWAGDSRVTSYIAFIDSAIQVLEDNKAPEPTPPRSVGGEFIGIDYTAILLAGAQMNAIWMLPLIAAAAVIGIVISRKF